MSIPAVVGGPFDKSTAEVGGKSTAEMGGPFVEVGGKSTAEVGGPFDKSTAEVGISFNKSTPSVVGGPFDRPVISNIAPPVKTTKTFTGRAAMMTGASPFDSDPPKVTANSSAPRGRLWPSPRASPAAC